MSVIGIDFGTSFCSASWVNPQTQRPEYITFNENGRTKIPSVVFFPEKGEPWAGTGPHQQLEYLGTMPKEQRMEVLQNTVISIKRKLKRNGRFRTATKDYTHQDVVAIILRKVKQEAERSCSFHDRISEVVLTHPVMFEEWKKQLLRDAATQAGFGKVTLLEEPVSAAVGYICSNDLPDTRGVMVYDWGAGTFDVAYVQIEHTGKDTDYRIPVTPRGDALCGGDDIDMVLYQEWEQLVQREMQRPLTNNSGEVDLGFLMRCRMQKEMMSTLPRKTFSELLPPIGGGLQQAQMELTREQFNEKISEVVNRTVSLTKEVYDEVKGSGLPIDYLVLIGGSSRIPLVEKLLRKNLPGVDIRTTGAVDAAVALGASYYHLVRNHIQDKDCFCIYCGEKISMQHQFCMFCGKPNYYFKK